MKKLVTSANDVSMALYLYSRCVDEGRRVKGRIGGGVEGGEEGGEGRNEGQGWGGSAAVEE